MNDNPDVGLQEDSPGAPDFRLQAQRAAEMHWDAVDGCKHLEEYFHTNKKELESTAVGPYCGCQTCIIREVLYAGWPYSQLEFIGWVQQFLRLKGQEDLADEIAFAAAKELGPTTLNNRQADQELLEAVTDHFL